jgi:hypothetical protein
MCRHLSTASTSSLSRNLRRPGLDAEARLVVKMDSLKDELAAWRPVVFWVTDDVRLPGAET